MAATASNTELPALLVVIMTSLGPDWRHDQLCRCYGVPDLLPVPKPILRMGPNFQRFSRHCLASFNVTVCALLLFTSSLVRILLRSVPTERDVANRHSVCRSHTHTHKREHNTLSYLSVTHRLIAVHFVVTSANSRHAI